MARVGKRTANVENDTTLSDKYKYKNDTYRHITWKNMQTRRENG